VSYVIKRNEDGAYVAPRGSASSYTKQLQNARTFSTREEAERERCGNETIHHAHDQLRRPR
jgi:hypothetical protein